MVLTYLFESEYGMITHSCITYLCGVALALYLLACHLHISFNWDITCHLAALILRFL